MRTARTVEPPRKHLVIAFDPGLATFGAVAIDTNGYDHTCRRADVFRSESLARKMNSELADDRVRRVRELSRWMSVWLDMDPVAVAAEAMSFPRGAHAIVAISLAWGVLVAELEHRQIPLVAALPFRWRKAINGTGNEADAWSTAVRAVPTFARCAEHIKRDDQEHALDALGVFVWAVRTDMIRSALRGSR